MNIPFDQGVGIRDIQKQIKKMTKWLIMYTKIDINNTVMATYSSAKHLEWKA